MKQKDICKTRNVLYFICFIILAGLTTTSCGAGNYSLYTGSPMPENKIAVLKTNKRTTIDLLDGNKLPGRGSWLDLSYRLELLPGTHNMLVSYFSSSSSGTSRTGFSRSTVSSKAPITLKFQVQAGHTYKLDTDLKNNSWFPYVMDIDSKEIVSDILTD